MLAQVDFVDADDLLETRTRTVPGRRGGGGRGGGGRGGGGRYGPMTEGGMADGMEANEADSAEVIEEVSIPRSETARGLALTHLHVTKGWDSLWSLLGRSNQIYFLSLAFDLSGEPPQIMPPKEFSGDSFIRMKPKETYEFTLGEGAPIFLPRQIVGGIALFVQVCEADDIDRAGATIKKIHKDLEGESASLIDRVKKLIQNPASEGVSQLLSAGFALLKPVATVLEANKDDHVGLVRGTFPARKSWRGRLIQDIGDGSFVRFAEIAD